VSPKRFASNCVEFSGGDAWPDGIDHRVSSFCNDSSRSQESFEIFVAVNGHGEILGFALGAPGGIRTSAHGLGSRQYWPFHPRINLFSSVSSRWQLGQCNNNSEAITGPSLDQGKLIHLVVFFHE
jgi:hypothetical protein